MPSLHCPAKINLFLEVGAKRPDGFHALGSLFQTVATGDVLHAEPCDTIVLTGAEAITQNPEDNLIVRAARLLKARFADRIDPAAGVHFTLEKNLPAGAGLGGGSSNAAAALRLTAALWNLPLTPEALRTLGAELGSDVPFFLSTATAYAEGRGEVLTPAPAPHPFHIVIATPPCHVETAWAYRALADERARTHAAPRLSRWADFRARYAAEAHNPEFYAELWNDFEAPVFSHFREILPVREILGGHSPVKTLLSGSGASLFSLFLEERDAERARVAVAPYCRFSVRTRLGASPAFLASPVPPTSPQNAGFF